MPTVTQPGGEEPRFSIAFLLSIINKAKVAEINLEDFTRDGFSERYRVSVMLWKLSMNVSPYTGLREGDALLAEKLVDEQERYLIFQPELDISQVYIKRMWVLGPLFFATVSQGLKVGGVVVVPFGFGPRDYRREYVFVRYAVPDW